MLSKETFLGVGMSWYRKWPDWDPWLLDLDQLSEKTTLVPMDGWYRKWPNWGSFLLKFDYVMEGDHYSYSTLPRRSSRALWFLLFFWKVLSCWSNFGSLTTTLCRLRQSAGGKRLLLILHESVLWLTPPARLFFTVEPWCLKLFCCSS